MKMCFMSTHQPSCMVHWFGVGFSLWPNYHNQPDGDSPICLIVTRFVGPCPCGGRDYHIWSNFFWKFYLIRTGFTLGELVPLVKVFRLFRLEWMFSGVQSVDTVGRCTTSYLLAGPACLWGLVWAQGYYQSGPSIRNCTKPCWVSSQVSRLWPWVSKKSNTWFQYIIMVIKYLVIVY